MRRQVCINFAIGFSALSKVVFDLIKWLEVGHEPPASGLPVHCFTV